MPQDVTHPDAPGPVLPGSQQRRPTPGSPAGGWRQVAPWLLVAGYLLASGIAVWLGMRSHGLFAPAGVTPSEWLANDLGAMVGFGVWVVFGALLVLRRPHNTVGWLMAASAALIALARVADRFADVAIGTSGEPSVIALTAALVSPGILLLGYLLGIVFLPLHYPDGELPSERWAVVGRLATAWIVVSAVAELLRPRLVATVSPMGSRPVTVFDVANPLSGRWAEPLTSLVSGAAPAVLVALLVAVAAAVSLRFRRSVGVERQQMKWFVSAVAMMALVVVFAFVTTVVLDVATMSDLVVTILLGAVLSAYPAAVGIAVLRHRLYEIDRIISRTVTYGLVVAVLAAVYAGAVIGLGAAATAVTGAQDADVVIAASTLLAAGLFRPVRSRVRTVVDRRFNRTGYEAQQAVETFARDVRDEVDVDRLRRRTAETAATAVEPTHVSLWLAHDRSAA